MQLILELRHDRLTVEQNKKPRPVGVVGRVRGLRCVWWARYSMSDGCGACRVCGASDAPPREAVENWCS